MFKFLKRKTFKLAMIHFEAPHTHFPLVLESTALVDENTECSPLFFMEIYMFSLVSVQDIYFRAVYTAHQGFLNFLGCVPIFEG